MIVALPGPFNFFFFCRPAVEVNVSVKKFVSMEIIYFVGG